MLIALSALILAQAGSSPYDIPRGAILDDHARRGATFERLVAPAVASPMACSRACNSNGICQSWTYRTGWMGQVARCDLHAKAGTPYPEPGAVTGLSLELARHIEWASDRPRSNTP